jgi:S-DNA-T family DNA segregation ATPase FtsK/SpoIIIE
MPRTVDEPVSSRRKKKSEPILIETILGVLSVVTLMIGALLVFAIVGAGGSAGNTLFTGLQKLFGVYSYLTPFIFFYAAYYLWEEEVPEINIRQSIGWLVIILGSAGFGNEITSPEKPFGGLLGSLLAKPLSSSFDTLPTLTILAGLVVIGLMVIANRKPTLSALAEPFIDIKEYLISLWTKRGFKLKQLKEAVEEEVAEEVAEVKEVAEEMEEVIEDAGKNVRDELFMTLTPQEEEVALAAIEKKESKPKPIILTPEFVPPPLDLLNVDSGKSGAGDTKTKMGTIQRTLEHFRINVEMGEVTVGPTVTQFTLKPAQGVNLSKVVALHDNLAMELGSEFLRIEAPIPGKTLVGIEIPNERKATLGLRSMLELEEFQNGPALMLAVGKSIVGKPLFGDLTKMPHLLVAGATRTGKSVTLQNLLISLLYKNSPYDLKLIILDPKRVEFTAYNNLPHLYTPIIKEPKSAIKALNWAIQEMERRYEVLAEYGQVNVEDYNKKTLSPALEKARKKAKEGDEITGIPPKMPYVVIVFDEYNDFMLSYPKEISPLITALTQKGRAAGIHLILATQRPDVKVITGTIKANIPARIALKTTSQIDSRTILDSSGAEDLLGNGDMLYMASDNPRLVRLQAPFVSTEEIHAVVSHIKKAHLDFIPDQIDISKVKVSVSSGDVGGEERNPGVEPTDDEDYMSAKDYVISTGKASTSSLQTAFRWGYNKAARIINDLEAYGVIGPARQGERYREILTGGQEMPQQESLAIAPEDTPVDDLFDQK